MAANKSDYDKHRDKEPKWLLSVIEKQKLFMKTKVIPVLGFYANPLSKTHCESDYESMARALLKRMKK